MENWWESQKSQHLRTALKHNLDVVCTCYRHENTSKESQEHIFEYFGGVPAISGRSRPLIKSAKIEKIVKNRKKCDFWKVDIFLYGGRKYDIWPEIGPLGPGKHPETLYCPSNVIWLHFTKSQKNRNFHFKNHGKNFFKANFLADVVRRPNQYWGSIDPIGAPKALLSCCMSYVPSYLNLALKIPKNSQKGTFFTFLLNKRYFFTFLLNYLIN